MADGIDGITSIPNGIRTVLLYMARCSIHQKSRLGNYTPKRRPRRPDEVLRRSIAVSAGIVSASVQYVRNIRSKQRPAALTSTLPSTQLSPHNGDMPQPQKSRMPCWRPEAPVLPFTPCRTLLGAVSSSLTSATNASSPVAEPRCRVCRALRSERRHTANGLSQRFLIESGPTRYQNASPEQRRHAR